MAMKRGAQLCTSSGEGSPVPNANIMTFGGTKRNSDSAQQMHGIHKLLERA
jgi:hypothetical protein